MMSRYELIPYIRFGLIGVFILALLAAMFGQPLNASQSSKLYRDRIVCEHTATGKLICTSVSTD